MSSFHQKQHSRADNDWGAAHHLQRAVDNWTIRGTSDFIILVSKASYVQEDARGGDWLTDPVLCVRGCAVDLHMYHHMWSSRGTCEGECFCPILQMSRLRLKEFKNNPHRPMLAKRSPLTPIPELFLWHGIVPYMSQGSASWPPSSPKGEFRGVILMKSSPLWKCFGFFSSHRIIECEGMPWVI